MVAEWKKELPEEKDKLSKRKEKQHHTLLVSERRNKKHQLMVPMRKKEMKPKMKRQIKLKEANHVMDRTALLQIGGYIKYACELGLMDVVVAPSHAFQSVLLAVQWKQSLTNI